MREVEWRSIGGIDCLVDELGEVWAQCRRTSEGMWLASFGADGLRRFADRDSARRMMLRRYEESLAGLKEASKKPTKEQNEKGKKDG